MRIDYQKWTNKEESRLESIFAKYRGSARREKLSQAFPSRSLPKCKDKAHRMALTKPVRWTIEKLKHFARKRRGTCLEQEYLGSRQQHRFRCAKGHKFSRRPGDIYSDSFWCHICRKMESDSKKLERLKQAGLKVGLLCLEPLWLGVHQKHRFKCISEGHPTSKVPTTVINYPTGCPHCSTGLGERICRIYFETLWGKEFLKCRPKWLVGSSGKRLELDGYCEELNLAFEHQGQQHIFGTRFTQTAELFANLQKNDKEKAALCRKQGIILITIPEVPVLTPFKQLRSYIAKQCKAKRVRLPRQFFHRKIDLLPAYSSERQHLLKKVVWVAKKDGYTCASNQYVHSQIHLKFKCPQGHDCFITPNNFLRGKRCSKCRGGVKKETIVDMQRIAKARGGRCLSPQYINAFAYLLWECAKGDLWWARPDSIKRVSWCPYCFNKVRAHKIQQRILKKVLKVPGNRALWAKYNSPKYRASTGSIISINSKERPS